MAALELPLGRRAYFKVPHLPGSRRPPSDRVAPAELAARCLVAPRPGEHVVVQEKLDGSCVAIAVVKGELVALGREGARADRSQNPGRQLFAKWVTEHAARLKPLVGEGEWIAGEWLALAHSTRYALSHAPFVAFDLFVGGKAVSLDVLAARVGDAVTLPHLLHRGDALGIEPMLAKLGERGGHGALDAPEGAVWRLERAGLVTGMAKYVRPGKVDGALLPENSGQPAVWNWNG